MCILEMGSVHGSFSLVSLHKASDTVFLLYFLTEHSMLLFLEAA